MYTSGIIYWVRPVTERNIRRVLGEDGSPAICIFSRYSSRHNAESERACSVISSNIVMIVYRNSGIQIDCLRDETTLFPSVIVSDDNSFVLSFVVQLLSPVIELVKWRRPLRADIVVMFLSSFSVARFRVSGDSCISSLFLHIQAVSQPFSAIWKIERSSVKVDTKEASLRGRLDGVVSFFSRSLRPREL